MISPGIRTDFKWNGEKWISALNLRGENKIVEEAANNAVKKIKQDIDELTSSGRVYKLIVKNGRRKYNHTSSAEGKAPNNLFGDLRDGIMAVRLKNSKWQIQSNAEHSAWLEFGTPRSAPRPFFEDNVYREFMKYYQYVEMKYKALILSNRGR